MIGFYMKCNTGLKCVKIQFEIYGSLFEIYGYSQLMADLRH